MSERLRSSCILIFVTDGEDFPKADTSMSEASYLITALSATYFFLKGDIIGPDIIGKIDFLG